MMMDARVSQILLGLLRDPVTMLVRHWNWKTAIVSSVCRAMIFFAENLPAGIEAGVRAMLIELTFRGVASGVLGSITQSLRLAEPPWAAAVAALLVLPAIGHGLEFIVHSLAGTPRLATSMGTSVAFSCVTTVFNLFVMRRGVLIVGKGQQTLIRDLSMMPRLVLAFVSSIRRAGVAALRRARARLSPDPI